MGFWSFFGILAGNSQSQSILKKIEEPPKYEVECSSEESKLEELKFSSPLSCGPYRQRYNLLNDHTMELYIRPSDSFVGPYSSSFDIHIDMYLIYSLRTENRNELLRIIKMHDMYNFKGKFDIRSYIEYLLSINNSYMNLQDRIRFEVLIEYLKEREIIN